jgi:hypothetical protein
MAYSSLDLESLERRLSQLLVELRDGESEQVWKEVETTSQSLANGLRVRDGPGMRVLGPFSRVLDPIV